jgi:hypothetical protein
VATQQADHSSIGQRSSIGKNTSIGQRTADVTSQTARRSQPRGWGLLLSTVVAKLGPIAA